MITEYTRRKSYINSRAFYSLIWETFARQGDCYSAYYERCGEDEYAHVLINHPVGGKSSQEIVTTDISAMELPELLIAVVENIDKHFRGYSGNE